MLQDYQKSLYPGNILLQPVSEKPKNAFARGLTVARQFGIRRLMVATTAFLSQRIFGRWEMALAYPEFKELSKAAITRDQAITFAFSFKRYGISVRPFQVPTEISRFLQIVEREQPKAVLEIGTGLGGTLFLFTRVSSPDAILITVDLPPTLLGIGAPRWREKLYKSFAIKSQTLQIVRGNSHDMATFNAIKQLLDGKKIDLLFLDGDHGYDGVKKDFDLYSQLVRERGLVAFHDILPQKDDPANKVPEFWNAIRDDYEHTQIIEEGSSCGTGILFLGQKNAR